MESSHVRLILFAMAALLVLAVLRMPYSYYQFMRVAVAAGAVIGAVHFYNRRGYLGAAACALAAVVFNPIAPLHFARETWAIVNLSFAAGLAVAAFYLPNAPQARP